MLTAATVPPKPARRAAAALKKALVDADRLDVTSGEMEAALFGVLEAAGLGAGVRATYGRVSRFLSARTGLAVVVAGAPWGGASGLAAKLAERLNLAAPAHTDLLAVALRGAGGALPPAPPWASCSPSPLRASPEPAPRLRGRVAMRKCIRIVHDRGAAHADAGDDNGSAHCAFGRGSDAPRRTPSPFARSHHAQPFSADATPPEGSGASADGAMGAAVRARFGNA